MMLASYAFNLISRFPQGGKASCDASPPVGEGWGGGKNICWFISMFMIHNTHFRKYIIE
jgi:hypothetical protein